MSAPLTRGQKGLIAALALRAAPSGLDRRTKDQWRRDTLTRETGHTSLRACTRDDMPALRAVFEPGTACALDVLTSNRSLEIARLRRHGNRARGMARRTFKAPLEQLPAYRLKTMNAILRRSA